jgi:hypothetical protein
MYFLKKTNLYRYRFISMTEVLNISKFDQSDRFNLNSKC